MLLTQFIGDSQTHAIPLTWGGAAFSPGVDYGLIFSAKLRAEDPDTCAIIQKASGVGLSVSGSTASVAIVPADTSELSACTLYCDVQAQNTETGEVRTVAKNVRLKLQRDITRGTTTTVPIYTTQEPAPFAGSETTETILEKLATGTGGTGRIGAEYMPDALSGAGNPNALGVTGIGLPGPVYFLPDGVGATGRVKWLLDDGTYQGIIIHFGALADEWTLSIVDGFNASNPSTETHVWDVDSADWVHAFGTGTPVFTEPASASHIGQLYLDTDTGVWYRWDGEEWVEQGGTVDAPAILAALASLDSGQIASLRAILEDARVVLAP